MEVGEQQSTLPIFSVADFMAVANQILDYSFPLVQVVGEVASFKVNQDKFIFFDLKDESGSLGCFMMKFKLRGEIVDGMKVVVTGRPNITKFSKFSLTLEQIQPFGEGGLKKQRDILYQKLEQEGLFNEARKRQLPELPERIGVISSMEAAGYKDFIKILNERWPGLVIVVKHTTVQGATAPDEIIKALAEFNQLPAGQRPELIAIVRGGGSKDDLACFDDEQLVRAIANSRLAVATGIGHEIDISLADLAADFRASTPSHLAQMLVPEQSVVLDTLEQCLTQITNQLTLKINHQWADLETLKLQLDQLVEDRFMDLYRRLTRAESLLAAFDPKQVLNKGYAIIRGQIAPNAELEVETKDKIIKTIIKEIYGKNN